MSTIKVTNLSGRGGASPNLPDGANVTGVVTATSFSGSGANLTGIANTDFVVGTAITMATGNIGNVNLTKSAGGVGATVGSFTGVTTYYGDGANLSGVGETTAPWHYNPDVNDLLAPVATGIGITFNKKIAAGSGTATLKIVNAGAAGTTVQSWGVSSCTFNVTQFSLGALVSNLTVNQTYQVDIPSGFIVDSAGTDYVGTAYTFAVLDAAGKLWTWGYDSDGMGGRNTNNVATSSPVQIPGLLWGDTSFNGGGSVVKFMGNIRSDGTLWMWGGATDGQRGDNTSSGHRSSPIQVGSDVTWNRLSIGTKGCTAVKTDGTLWAWGMNQYGQLGHNNTTYYSSPVQIPGTTWRSFEGGTTLSVLATKTDNTLWSWGGNSEGQLGLNNRTYYSSPAQIPGTTWTINVDHDDEMTIAVKTDGTLWSWGKNDNGNLGTNNRTSYSSPAQVPGTTWAKEENQVASGTYGTHGIKTDGTMWLWGYNNQGQLGLNQAEPTKISSPTQLGSGTDWHRVRKMYYAVMALEKDYTP